MKNKKPWVDQKWRTIPARKKPSRMDDKNKKSHDAKLVSANEPYEVKYLLDKWDISEEDLRLIIKHFGPSRDAVEVELLKQNYHERN